MSEKTDEMVEELNELIRQAIIAGGGQDTKYHYKEVTRIVAIVARGLQIDPII